MIKNQRRVKDHPLYSQEFFDLFMKLQMNVKNFQMVLEEQHGYNYNSPTISKVLWWWGVDHYADAKELIIRGRNLLDEEIAEQALVWAAYRRFIKTEFDRDQYNSWLMANGLWHKTKYQWAGIYYGASIW